MALLGGEKPREGYADIERRLGIAQDGQPSQLQLEVQRELRERIANIAHLANESIADGRNKSLGLTALEDALLRFGKAIFE